MWDYLQQHCPIENESDTEEEFQSPSPAQGKKKFEKSILFFSCRIVKILVLFILENVFGI